MYSSPDEARSDLFLAGAVYIFGPLVLRLLLTIVPLGQIPILRELLFLAAPLLFTALVPYLLIRYRRESWRDYGISGASGEVGVGLVTALPIVVASVLAAVVTRGNPLAGIPLAADSGIEWLQIAQRLLEWLGLAFLAVYATVKARDAFRADYRTVRDGLWQIGRWVGIVAAVTTLLLLTALGLNAERILLPLGVAGAVALVYQGLAGRSTTTLAALLTPTVLLALGPFALSFNASVLVFSVWQAALVAAIGLMIGTWLESRRSAMPAFGLAVAVALLTIL